MHVEPARDRRRRQPQLGSGRSQDAARLPVTGPRSLRHGGRKSCDVRAGEPVGVDEAMQVPQVRRVGRRQQHPGERSRRAAPVVGAAGGRDGTPRNPEPPSLVSQQVAPSARVRSLAARVLAVGDCPRARNHHDARPRGGDRGQGVHLVVRQAEAHRADAVSHGRLGPPVRPRHPKKGRIEDTAAKAGRSECPGDARPHRPPRATSAAGLPDVVGGTAPSKADEPAAKVTYGRCRGGLSAIDSQHQA